MELKFILGAVAVLSLIVVTIAELSVSTKKFNAVCKHIYQIECVFSGVNINKSCLFVDLLKVQNNDESHWNLIEHVIKNDTFIMDKLKITKSSIPFLTNEWCTVFPNITSFFIVYASLQTILPNALFNCLSLNVFHSYGNNIKQLDSYTFRFNLNLGTLSIQNSNLQSFSGKMFMNLSNINSIDFSDNNLTQFPSHEFPIMNKVTSLYLYANNIYNIDEQEIFYKFPHLEFVYIHNNLFECERLRIIINFFKRSTNIVLGLFNKFYQKRNNFTTAVDHIDCLSREQLLKYFMRQLLEKQIRNSENSPGELQDIINQNAFTNIAHEMTFSNDPVTIKDHYDEGSIEDTNIDYKNMIEETEIIKTFTTLKYDADYINTKNVINSNSNADEDYTNKTTETFDRKIYGEQHYLLVNITLIVVCFFTILFLAIVVWTHKLNYHRNETVAPNDTLNNNNLELI